FVLLYSTYNTYICTPSLHDALPISSKAKINAAHLGALARFDDDVPGFASVILPDFQRHDRRKIALGFKSGDRRVVSATAQPFHRSEEHTSELQSRENLVCRLLLEKK